MCGDTVSVVVTVQRESEEDEEEEKGESNVGRVVCPRYGLEKQEAYWLVIGDTNSNALLSIKRISIGDKPTKVRDIRKTHAWMHLKYYLDHLSCPSILYYHPSDQARVHSP